MSSLNILLVQPISIAGRLIVSSINDGILQNPDLEANITVFDELFANNLDELLQKKFNVIIGYDFSPLKIKIDNNLEAKCICYFADNIQSKTSGPEWEKYFKYLYREDVFTFFWDREMIKMYDFKNLYYLPQFVNFEIYRDLNITPKFHVMFAGRLDTDFRLNFYLELMKKLPELKFAWYAIEKHYRDALSRTEDKELIKNVYQGFIDNQKDMAVAINNSKILFTMNSQGISSLNFRTIESVACKRLIISDKRQELSLYNGYMPYWENVDDLADKIRFYLKNETEYETTVENCYKIGRKDHHTKENVAYMFDKALAANA